MEMPLTEIRDRIAVEVMKVMLTSISNDTMIDIDNDNVEAMFEVASGAYNMAEIMLLERNNRGECSIPEIQAQLKKLVDNEDLKNAIIDEA
jgi:hypothetical protein